MTEIEVLALRLVELLEARRAEHEFGPGVHELCIAIKRLGSR